jgi:hypothetical protein
MNVEIGKQNIIIMGNNKAVQFHCWEYLNCKPDIYTVSVSNEPLQIITFCYIKAIYKGVGW